MKTNRKKTLRWSLVLLTLLLLMCWVWSRWDAWFRNPDEVAYVSSKTPEHVLLTFGDSTALARNISWQCDSVVRPSWLELAADSDTIRVEASGEVFRSRQGVAAYYVARLRDLQPDTRYAYRAVTDGKASPWYHFRTWPDHRDSLSFLYVGDVQDTIGGQANRFLREALARHPECEFLVCGGDLTERPTRQHWEETFRDIDSIAQAMPLLCVTGNHDYLKGVIMHLERRFTLTCSYFLDSKIADNHVFTFCDGPAQFFLLDSNRELPYLFTQRQWLKSQLHQSQARWKIVILHHPLFSLKGNNNLFQRWMFNDLIEDEGVDLVLQGHEHAYGRMTAHDAEGKPVPSVYTVSHCSPKNYKIKNLDRFDIQNNTSRFYQTVKIFGDTLSLSAYEVYGHTLIDSLLIVKSASSRPMVLPFPPAKSM